MSATSQSLPSSLEPAATRPAAAKPAAPIFNQPGTFWIQHREASLNWLAFGLLLAAWNAAGDDSSGAGRRPDALRGYSSVSVRAAQRSLPQGP
jgi:hypothetical protein